MYFKKLTEILLPPLCVLSIIILFSSFSFYSGKFASALSLPPLFKRLSTDTQLCYKIGYNCLVISIKRYSFENTENPSVKLCGFILFPYFS